MRLFVENALAPEPQAELVDEIVAYRTANPPDGAGWYAQAGAGAAHDALARLGEIACRRSSCTAPPTTSSMRATRELLAEQIPGARLELFDGVGPPAALGAAGASSPRSWRSSSRERLHTIDRWLRDRRGGRRSASRSTISAAT